MIGRTNAVSSGGGSPDYSLRNQAFWGSVNLHEFRYASGFSENMSSIQPIDSTQDAAIDIDWSKAFEIFVTFKITGSLSSTGKAFYGNGTSGFYRTPSAELSSNNSGTIWAGISANGSSWGNNLEIRASDGATFPQNTWLTFKCSYDGTNWSIEYYDGTNTITKTAAVSGTPYHSTSYYLVIGNSARSRKSTNLVYDLNNCYIKSQGVMVWGHKE